MPTIASLASLLCCAGALAQPEGVQPQQACQMVAVAPLQARGQVAAEDAWLGQAPVWWFACAAAADARLVVSSPECADRRQRRAEECPTCDPGPAKQLPAWRVTGTFATTPGSVAFELVLAADPPEGHQAQVLRLEGARQDLPALLAQAWREVTNAVGVPSASPGQAFPYDSPTNRRDADAFRAFVEAMRNAPAWPWHLSSPIPEDASHTARAAHEAILAAHPSFWPSRLVGASLAAASGQFKASLDLIADDRAGWPPALRPQLWVWHHLLGAAVLGDQTARRDLRPWLEACVAAGSPDPDVYSLVGDMVGLRDPKGALPLYEKAVALSGQPGDLYVALADARVRAGDPPGALEALSHYEAADPLSHLTVHTIAGEAHAGLGDADRAFAEFRAAVAIQPDEWTVHYAFACSARALKLYDVEVQQLRELVRVGHDNFDTWYDLAAACLRADDADGVQEAFARLEQLDPEKSTIARLTILASFYEERPSADPDLAVNVTLELGPTSVYAALRQLSPQVGRWISANWRLRGTQIELNVRNAPAWQVMQSIADQVPARWLVAWDPDGHKVYRLNPLEPVGGHERFRAADPGADPDLGVKVTLDLGETSVAEALKQLSALLGRTISAIPDLQELRIELTVADTPAWQVMESIGNQIPGQWRVARTHDGETVYQFGWIGP